MLRSAATIDAATCAKQLVMATSERSSRCLEINSFVRGYHAYMDVWDPVIGEILQLEKEPSNRKDQKAVAVVKNGEIVGHLPAILSSTVFYYLTRSSSSGIAKISGQKVNRGAGYGLEVPCMYCFYGPEKYLTRLREVLDRLDLEQ